MSRTQNSFELFTDLKLSRTIVEVMKKKNAAIVLTALITGLTLYYLFDRGFLRFNYPSESRFPVRGIDVSHHQGEIDWFQVKAEGFHFVFIKATEGGDFKDRSFTQNWNAAISSGMRRGAYHFFTFCRSGIDQARNFLATVPQEKDDLPFVLDLEFGGNCKKTLTPEILAAEVRGFVIEVQKNRKEKPIFYVTPEFFEEYLEKHASLFPEHTLWLRNVFREPSQNNCEKWSLWQFANRGRIKGVNGPVDLNVFCGDFNKFIEVFGRTSSDGP